MSIAGAEILADVKAVQNVRMRPDDGGREEEEVFVIPAHTLYGDYPPKIAEAEIKPVNESGEIVLSRVVVRSISWCMTVRPGTVRQKIIM